ncbi:MAG TPA: hypothetical protein VK186_28200 [Candidatus Deferrimicrobium sp.]|nr:hypothetical protein [Candidatus Deferrimicrobium sp.]
MKIKMIAIAPYDGWAFIIKEEQLYLLRPPYRSKDLLEVGEKDLENALHKYGFQEFDHAFNNLAETIDYLNEKYMEAMKRKGISLPDKEQLKELLEYATEEILVGYLEKAEREFIPQRNLDAAESIALALLPLEKVIQNEDIFQKTYAILNRCKEERERLNNIIKTPNKATGIFPTAELRYTLEAIRELSEFFYRKKQLLPVGA